jgi:hypothetical protein
MRYRSPAAGGGSAPVPLRGPRPLRTMLAVATAGAIGLIPVALVATPAFAAISVSNSGPVTEGTAVTVTISGATADTYAVTTTPAPTTGVAGAVSGTDYTALTSAQQTLTITASGTATLTINTIDDSLYEGPEAFTVTVTGTAVGNTTPAPTTVTINDNDSKPSFSLSASPTQVTEALGAKSTITATLSAMSGVTTTIAVNTADTGTAVAGTPPVGDYTALTGATITIQANNLTGTTDVQITDDGVKDTQDVESFAVNASSSDTLNGTASTTVSIKDAQSAPKVTLSVGGTIAEGSPVTFTVTTDTKSELPITVQWDSVDVTPASGHGTATAGTDFPYPAPAVRTVTITPKTFSQTFQITPAADGLNELPEDFAIQLANPVNAVLGTTIKVGGTITDSVLDLPPTLSIAPSVVAEGDSGTKAQTFTALLSGPSGRTVKAAWATADGTATAGKDYVAASGTLTFPPGTTSQTFTTISIIGDTIDEDTGEAFKIMPSAIPGETSLTLPTGPNPFATVTITDDDAAPTIASFDNKSVDEGNDTSVVLLPLKLSNASSHQLTFTVAGAGSGTNPASTATLGVIGTNDFTVLNTTVVIPPDTATAYVGVLINGDNVYEPDETADIGVNGSGSSTYLTAPYTATSVLTILNNDKAPNLKINNVTGNEGDTVNITGTLTGMAAASTTFNVWFTGMALNGKQAADPSDFTNPGVVQVGVIAGTAATDSLALGTLTLTDDTVKEPEETIQVTGNTTGNVGTVQNGVVAIAASDGGSTTPPPTTSELTIIAPSNVIGAVAVPIHGTAAASTPVVLWGAPMGGGEMMELQTVESDAQGNWSTTRWIGVGYKFSAASGDDTTDPVTVTITQSPLFVATSPSAGVVSFIVQGNPRDAGQTVVVQRYLGGKWVNIARGITASNNQWRGSVKIASKTAIAVRGFVVGYVPDGIFGGYSSVKRLTVK